MSSVEEAEKVRHWGITVETEMEEVEEVEVEGVEEVWAVRRFDVIQSSHISKFAGPVRTGQVTALLEDDSGIM